MRPRNLNAVLTAATLALALQCAPALASKPAHAQDQSQEQRKGKDHGKKIDARNGSPQPEAVARRAGFVAVNDDRDRDGDRDAGWANDPRYRDRWGNNDRDRDDRWSRDDRDNDHDGDDRRWSRDDRDNDHDQDDNRWRDSRDWNRYYSPRDARYYNYPSRGYIVYRLPPRYNVVQFRGVPYYFSEGSWYSPYNTGYRVVSPPVGLLLSFLPEIYQRLMFGGTPYYQANDVYYRWMPQYNAYMVSAWPGR